MEGAFLTCWQRLSALPVRALPAHPVPPARKGARPGAVVAGTVPGTPDSTTRHHANRNQTKQPKPGTTQSVIRLAGTMNH
jgi:hypothetical protein